METKRAQTLEALETFIQTQRALLTRTQFDIEQLQRLKRDAIAQPSTFLSNLSNHLDDSAFRISDRDDCRLTVPEGIDWSVYEGHDPIALQTLAFSSRNKYAQRNQPHFTQRTPLSDLQKLVKDARRTIIDPVLVQFEGASEPESDDPEDKRPQMSLEEIRRERERNKLRELKKRKIQSVGGLKLPSHRSRGPSGVFVRRDAEDESLDVDISFDDAPNGDPDLHLTNMDIDPPNTPTRYLDPAPPPPPIPPSHPRNSRARRPSNKLQTQGDTKKANATKPRRKSKIDIPIDDISEPPPPAVAPKRSREMNKPKPETYKQAWSGSEQHLLEQLLEQIPEGEKNRWQKISRAMNGKRTPRQVASRVQKYFEKLKRFGIGGG